MGKFYEIWEVLKNNEKVSTNLVSILAGVLGALVAVFSGEKKRSTRRVISIFVIGLSAPSFIAPLVFYWMGVPETLEPSVSFACGAFGMAVFDKIADLIRDIDFKTIISILKKK
jgi:ABC-type dipeptide/oligopeptide/nickel transport system permease component